MRLDSRVKVNIHQTDNRGQMFDILEDECDEDASKRPPPSSNVPVQHNQATNDEATNKKARQRVSAPPRPRSYHGHLINSQGIINTASSVNGVIPKPNGTAPMQDANHLGDALPADQRACDAQWKFEPNAIKLVIKRNYNAKELTKRIAVALRAHNVSAKNIQSVVPFQGKRNVIVHFKPTVNINCSELFNKTLRLEKDMPVTIENPNKPKSDLTSSIMRLHYLPGNMDLDAIKGHVINICPKGVKITTIERERYYDPSDEALNHIQTGAIRIKVEHPLSAVQGIVNICGITTIQKLKALVTVVGVPPRCLFCSEFGHTRRSCGKASLLCTKCNNRGHAVESCTFALRLQASNNSAKSTELIDFDEPEAEEADAEQRTNANANDTMENMLILSSTTLRKVTLSEGLALAAESPSMNTVIPATSDAAMDTTSTEPTTSRTTTSTIAEWPNNGEATDSTKNSTDATYRNQPPEAQAEATSTARTAQSTMPTTTNTENDYFNNTFNDTTSETTLQHLAKKADHAHGNANTQVNGLDNGKGNTGNNSFGTGGDGSSSRGGSSGGGGSSRGGSSGGSGSSRGGSSGGSGSSRGGSSGGGGSNASGDSDSTCDNSSTHCGKSGPKSGKGKGGGKDLDKKTESTTSNNDLNSTVDDSHVNKKAKTKKKDGDEVGEKRQRVKSASTIGMSTNADTRATREQLQTAFAKIKNGNLDSNSINTIATVKPKQVRVNAQASTNQAVDKDSAKPSGDTHLSANSLTPATANDPTLATIAFKDVFDSVDVSRLFESILQDTRELHQQAPYQQLSQTALLPTETSTSSATSQQHLSYSLQQEQQQAQGSNSSTSATNQLLF